MEPEDLLDLRQPSRGQLYDLHKFLRELSRRLFLNLDDSDLWEFINYLRGRRTQYRRLIDYLREFNQRRIYEKTYFAASSQDGAARRLGPMKLLQSARIATLGPLWTLLDMIRLLRNHHEAQSQKARRRKR